MYTCSFVRLSKQPMSSAVYKITQTRVKSFSSCSDQTSEWGSVLFNHGEVVGARQTGLSSSEPADLQGFSLELVRKRKTPVSGSSA